MKKILMMMTVFILLISFSAAGSAQTKSFTGEAQGFGGPVKVTLTMENGVITEAVVIGAEETQGYGASALESLAAQILAAQSVEIDGVAGATVTSRAAKEAAGKAFDAAKGVALETTVLKNGIYTATAESFQFEHVTVSVRIADGKIVDVVIDEITDHPTTITDAPCELMPAAIVANQTYQVDGVTGATFTSNAIRNAVRDCLEQAGGAAAFSRPVTKPDPVAADAVRTDILIVGGGAAGMTAALEAIQGDTLGTESGIKVTLIEKAGFLGGSTSVSGGGFIKWVDESGAYGDVWLENSVNEDLEIIRKDMQTPFNSALHRGEFSVMKRTNE